MFKRCLSLKWGAACQPFIEHHPQTVDVRLLSSGPFRRVPAPGTCRSVCRRLLRIAFGRDPLSVLGEAEVSDVGYRGLIEQDIGGLEVAVQNTALMGVMDGSATVARREAASRSQRCMRQTLGEFATIDQFHAVSRAGRRVRQPRRWARCWDDRARPPRRLLRENAGCLRRKQVRRCGSSSAPRCDPAAPVWPCRRRPCRRVRFCSRIS